MQQAEKVFPPSGLSWGLRAHAHETGTWNVIFSHGPGSYCETSSDASCTSPSPCGVPSLGWRTVSDGGICKQGRPFCHLIQSFFLTGNHYIHQATGTADPTFLSASPSDPIVPSSPSSPQPPGLLSSPPSPLHFPSSPSRYSPRGLLTSVPQAVERFHPHCIKWVSFQGSSGRRESGNKARLLYLVQSFLGHSYILFVQTLLLQKFLYSVRVVWHAQSREPFLLKGQLGLTALSSFLKHTLLSCLTWRGQG